jgi:hypothetical protein
VTRLVCTGAALVLAVAAASLWPGSRTTVVAADAVPRLANGLPDLNGVWSFATLTPLERPADQAGKATLSEEEARAIEARTLDVQNRDRRDSQGGEVRGTDGRTDLDRAYNQFWWDYGTRVVGTRQTSLVVDPPDGRIPPLLPDAARLDAARTATYAGSPAGPEDRPIRERCLNKLTAGPPMLPGPYNNNVQLFVTPSHVAIYNEMIHDVRLVPLDGRAHLPASMPQMLGDSRGRWEGDTLVVDTVNFTATTAFRGSTAAMHLVERFTRTAAGSLLYEFTVSDPSAWARPWSVALPMAKTDEKIYEYACHEGNMGLEAILRGARADERRPAAR